ncbi:ABC transporter substrate-binding protein [Clostridium sp. E02]|uniref:ABC transporter substrate-binding protein n=1 Tax=Clostridium sp. E02 TaxID=2487134 RepID=UPI000F535C59|nr:ABC transporter substrate-binding protein [Clostridium sp. E02]
MKVMKRFGAFGLAAVLAVSLTACGGAKSSGSVKGQQTVSDIPKFNNLKVGEDYTDIKADLKFITHKTDAVDTTFKDYIKQFQKMYPNVTITYEGVTNYADDMITRLTTGDWGDICMIPVQVDKDELENYFLCLGDKPELEKKYIMLNNFSFKNKVYGMPSDGNAQGIVYNKKVFEEAGITELPKTPDEFLDALLKIKENTDAIPLYTNFAAGWTMTAWDSYITGSATGNPDYVNEILVHQKNPFAKQKDMTGPYAVYYTLYEAVKRGLIEDDPTTTDWEGSKGIMNNGKIGTMVLGSWAVTQMQAAGDHPDDIGYMAFPITVNGKQYATAGPDYNYGININSSADNQIASMLYVKWLTEDSNFAYDEGCIPICVDSKYPDIYKTFDHVELVIDNPAPEGEESLYNDINNDSEVGINTSPDGPSKILEAAVAGSPSLDEIMDDWNKRWMASQKKYGAIQ